MGLFHPSHDELCDILTQYDSLVEVGVGHRTNLAAELVDAGVSVTATDVHPYETPDGVSFVRDDIVEPDIAVYDGADALYSCNLPPELHRPARSVARAVDADLIFTTLGTDQPAIPVERRTVKRGSMVETVYFVGHDTG